ncbi:glycosyltransferase [Streptomyces lonarensis]|uniref:glycosyltransferase n=1 Tax=Streptomyces lonarensis TaxID=700599 RepID=UPI0028B07497|nr:nucleotide disphospho-sugar-binding domain-containing protein [Streptomyces lonarensis]
MPYNGPGPLPDGLPAELARTAARGGPDAETDRRVLVSLGTHTLALNGVPLLRGILTAFEDMAGTEAVATVPERFREELGPVPENVHLIDPVPLQLIVGGCAAVVHHGGSGTGTTTAACHGVPQLVLPQMNDAFAYGDMLPPTGAGITVEPPPEQNDPQVLRKAITTLLSDASYREAAGTLRDGIEAMPAPAALVPTGADRRGGTGVMLTERVDRSTARRIARSQTAHPAADDAHAWLAERRGAHDTGWSASRSPRWTAGDSTP